jgi:hypothetical protein
MTGCPITVYRKFVQASARLENVTNRAVKAAA